MEREAPQVIHVQNLEDAGSGGGGQARLVEQAPAAGARRQMAASFQLNVDNVAQIVCPHCNKPSESIGLALNLTVGPVPEGVQVLLVRPGATMRSVVDDVRRALINDALSRVNGNQARAAKLLGMKYTTFHTLSRRLGIVSGRSRDERGAADEGAEAAVGSEATSSDADAGASSTEGTSGGGAQE